MENRASQAVAAARGTVDAAAGVMLFGILKLIRSSARVYCAYAPRPLISPGTISECIVVNMGERRTAPYQARNLVPGFDARHVVTD